MEARATHVQPGDGDGPKRMREREREKDERRTNESKTHLSHSKHYKVISCWHSNVKLIYALNISMYSVFGASSPPCIECRDNIGMFSLCSNAKTTIWTYCTLIHLDSRRHRLRRRRRHRRRGIYEGEYQARKIALYTSLIALNFTKVKLMKNNTLPCIAILNILRLPSDCCYFIVAIQ